MPFSCISESIFCYLCFKVPVGTIEVQSEHWPHCYWSMDLSSDWKLNGGGEGAQGPSVSGLLRFVLEHHMSHTAKLKAYCCCSKRFKPSCECCDLNGELLLLFSVFNLIVNWIAYLFRVSWFKDVPFGTGELLRHFLVTITKPILIAMCSNGTKYLSSIDI